MLSAITHLVIDHAVYAVAALLALDALLPAGSEITMLLAGAVGAGAVPGAAPQLFGTTLTAGPEAFVVLALAGTLGYVGGALAGWVIGRRAGARLLTRSDHRAGPRAEHVRRARRWYDRHGTRAVFLGRLTPVVRSFISVCAGALGTPLGPYLALTTLGSALWCFPLAAAGWIAGRSYERLGHAAGYADAVIAAVALAAAGWTLLRWRSRSTSRPATEP